ncbi:hypothetical protein E2C01_076868 [Portunus trituberculatus]|uniref:Uncharacterized protein n=1 Tax=Portunus trituberculatus TaxID=210409 RepID=A0A5B7IN46_PORTR|nr:hypothetical protein [Portunus trituberculatus]
MASSLTSPRHDPFVHVSSLALETSHPHTSPFHSLHPINKNNANNINSAT